MGGAGRGRIAERKPGRAGGVKRSLLQPFIVGLFCLLLVSLFFVTALMDVRRTQNTLLDVFENKAVTIVESVEMIAQNKIKDFMGITNRAAAHLQGVESIEEGFRMQEAILARLIEFGKEVDRRESAETLSKEEMGNLASEAGLFSLVVSDAHGEIVYESRPLPKEVSPRLQVLLKAQDEIMLDFYGDTPGENCFYLLGVRRENGRGMIVSVLGGEGLQHWASRVALQEAIEESGWRKGIHYFVVVDARGRFLAGAGALPEVEGEGVPMADARSRRRIVGGNPELLEVDTPLRLNDARTEIARVGLEIAEVSRLRQRNQSHIFFSTGLIMIGSVFAVLLFYRIQTRHLRKLEEMKERLSQAERLSSLGRLAAGLAHEIRNPLNAISVAIQRIHREYSPSDHEKSGEFSHLVSLVREEIRRLNQIIEDFVGPARQRQSEFREGRLVDLLERVVQLVKEEAASRDIRIQVEWENPDVVVFMDSARMHQAVLNLMKNAMESISGQGVISLSTRSQGSRHVQVRIQDTGLGIPAKDLERVFEFEYTTKEKGLGLGLPIAREIVRAHGGEIGVNSESGKGTSFELTLPCKEK